MNLWFIVLSSYLQNSLNTLRPVRISQNLPKLCDLSPHPQSLRFCCSLYFWRHPFPSLLSISFSGCFARTRSTLQGDPRQLKVLETIRHSHKTARKNKLLSTFPKLLKRPSHGKLKLANSCWQTQVDVCERHKNSRQTSWQTVGDKQNLPLFSPTFSPTFSCW